MAQDFGRPVRSAVETLNPPKNWEEYFSRITYRPDHEFYYSYMIDYDGHKVVIVRPVEDTYNPGKMVKVAFTRHLPPWIFFNGQLELVDRFMRAVFHDMETHEADEWFRRDGVMLFDPHAHDGIWGN